MLGDAKSSGLEGTSSSVQHVSIKLVVYNTYSTQL